MSPRIAARIRSEIAAKRAEMESLRSDMATLQQSLQELADEFRRDMQDTIAEAITHVAAASQAEGIDTNERAAAE